MMRFQSILSMKEMTHRRRKKKPKVSPLANTTPARYRAFPFMHTRWLTEIDKFARKKKKKTPRALRHPHN